MQARLITLGLALLVSGTAQAAYSPIALTPESYNVDLVVEKSVKGAVPSTTASMDGGTNNDNATWYEIGYNTNADALTTGIPAAGSTFTSQADSLHQFQMAPSYTNNCVILLDSSVTNATMTFKTPAKYGAFSLLTSGGNGGCGWQWTAHFADGTTESGQGSSPDWFFTPGPAFTANGRATTAYDLWNVNSDNPRLYSRDFTISKTNVNVTSIDLKFTSSQAGAHTFFMALSGAPDASSLFVPVAFTGYNQDGVIEASAPHRGSVQYATTASMDGGKGNTGATWYERGFDPAAPTTGVPPAGSLVTNISATDRVYKLASDYTTNNAILIDTSVSSADLVFGKSASYSALSLLLSSGGGKSAIAYTINYTNGNQDFGNFTAPDWYNGTPAFISNGRVNVENGVPDTVNANNPRIYGIDIIPSTSSSPIASVTLSYNDTGNYHVGVWAISGTAGAIKPIIDPQPQSQKVALNDYPYFQIGVSGTSPFTYQWQKATSTATNALFTNITDNAVFRDSQTATLSFWGVTMNEDGLYRVIVHNSAGYATSQVATLTVISPLQSVTAPSDPVVGFGGNWPDGENPTKVIDGTTSKYLNFGKVNTGFTVSPSMGLSFVTGVRFYCANDATERDPSEFRLEGSLDGSIFTTIASGPLSLPDARNDGGLTLTPLTQAMQQILFTNSNSYAVYRVTFPHLKNESGANSMQIGEVELLGVADTSGRPHFTQFPSAKTVYLGSPVTFTAKAVGTPDPTYQWRKGTNGVYVDVVDSPNITGSQTDTLTISAAALADGADYIAVASNTAGNISSLVAKLRVLSSTPNVLSLTDLITAFGDTNSPVIVNNVDPTNAVDGTTTKYVATGHSFGAMAGFGPFEGPVGLIITPASGPTVITGVRLFTGDATSGMDPADFTLEGSNNGGSSYVQIASSPLDLPSTRNNGGTAIDPLTQANQEVLFDNATSYTSYRITFNNIRDTSALSTANSLQFGELQLLGTVGEALPATLTIVNDGDGNVTISTTKAGELFSTGALDGANTSWADEGAITDSVKLQIGNAPRFFRLVVQ